MSEEFNLTQYLSRTNTSFIVGDVLNSMTGCNILVSLHLEYGPHYTQNETKSFTYVSHSVKEFFDNVQKVPEKFLDASAYHLCVDPQVQWVGVNRYAATVHDHPDLFKPQHESGPDALAKEIIANITNHSGDGGFLYLGEPISVGYVSGTETRFDWEQDKQMHNLSKVDGGSGANITKQWLNIGNKDTITKLSMVCTKPQVFIPRARPLPDDKDADDAGVALFSSYLPVQVLFALFAASLIMSCA